MTILRSKVIVLGAPNVGKTSIISVLQNKNAVVSKNYKMTMGVEA